MSITHNILILLVFGAASTLLGQPGDGDLVESFTANGSGCPVNGSNTGFEIDGGLVLTSDSFFGQAGPEISRRDGRKNCQFTFALNIPDGWQYAVKGVSFQGLADLDKGAKATVKVSHFFQGNSNTQFAELEIEGLAQKFFTNTGELEGESVWSACGVQRASNVNVSVSVNNRGNKDSFGFLLLGDLLAGLRAQVDLDFRPCSFDTSSN